MERPTSTLTGHAEALTWISYRCPVSVAASRCFLCGTVRYKNNTRDAIRLNPHPRQPASPKHATSTKMLFTKHLTTLLLGAAAAFSPFTSATPVPEPAALNTTETSDILLDLNSALVARATKFSSLKGSDASWQKLSTLCAQGKRKRSLQLRQVTWPPATPKGFTAVLQGKSDAAFASGNGLWTYGLVTCLGISVVGTPPSAIAEPRHMLHMESTKLVMDAQWETFEKRVKGAKLTKMKGYMSVPDTTKNLPPTWDAGMTQLTNDIIAEAKTQLQALTGSAPVVKTRPMSRGLAHETPYGTMWVDNRNDVYIEGLKA
ncbi:hypothetical protein B0T16DRAFT_490829 [Cercophora newfieldiana]|uniref:Uncharacterized protein n=1 Tax=Cercophora newfieldiana TaxID=92897 RepID=A0AA40CVN1_9PEZI|nr:hypothetical protein B0T16DRAFT_490829 [Cercophora newfieldiana]